MNRVPTTPTGTRVSRVTYGVDLLEVALIAFFAAVSGATLVTAIGHQKPSSSDPDVETESYFAARFGTTSHSSTHAEEFLVRDFFRDRRDGIFVDVGASHYRDNSNTYFLETHLGWSGLAIDAQQEYAEGYVQNRPRTRYVTAFVNDHGNSSTSIFIPPAGKNRQIASGQEKYVTSTTGIGEVREVPTVTLDALLSQAAIAQFQFLSLDIELFEPKALAGFNIGHHRPELVCVEAQLPVRQQILDYFARHRYVVVGRYLRTDTANLYFMPIDRVQDPELPQKLEGYAPTP